MRKTIKQDKVKEARPNSVLGILILFVVLLGGVTALVPHTYKTVENPRTKITNSYLTSKKQNEIITLSQSQKIAIMDLVNTGMLKINPQLNRVEIHPRLWESLEYSAKKGLASNLAIYCGNRKGTYLYWCKIYDVYSGKKLAKYSQSWGFKVY